MVKPKPETPALLLRDARKRAGLSQKGLARAAGTSQSVVARIEEGKASPTWVTMERLLMAAGQELVAGVEVAAVLDPQELEGLERTLQTTPETLLREVAAVDRFVKTARRV